MEKITKRVAGTSNIPAEYLTEYPPIPKSVKIELTSRCDLQCIFCSLTYKERATGDINRDFLFRLLAELSEAGVEEVGLFWLGDPLLVSALPEYVAYAKKIGIKYVFITTNGRLATPKMITPLIESGIDSIKFSINANNRENYLKLCGVDAFDKIISNLKSTWEIRGNKEKPAIYASSIFDPNNREIFEEIHSRVKPYVDEHYPLRMYGKATLSEQLYGVQLTSEPIIKPRSLEDMLPCWSLFTLPHISYEGHLSACYCDHDPRLFMADLKKLSFKEAWHSPKLVELRKQHLKRAVTGHVCENCIAYKH